MKRKRQKKGLKSRKTGMEGGQYQSREKLTWRLIEFSKRQENTIEFIVFYIQKYKMNSNSHQTSTQNAKRKKHQLYQRKYYNMKLLSSPLQLSLMRVEVWHPVLYKHTTYQKNHRTKSVVCKPLSYS